LHPIFVLIYYTRLQIQTYTEQIFTSLNYWLDIPYVMDKFIYMMDNIINVFV